MLHLRPCTTLLLIYGITYCYEHFDNSLVWAYAGASTTLSVPCSVEFTTWQHDGTRTKYTGMVLTMLALTDWLLNLVLTILSCMSVLTPPNCMFVH